VSPQDAEALVRTPVQDVSAELLQTFIFNALAETWGTSHDLWFYLPRILELLADGDIGRRDIGNLFTIMGAHWHDWPQDQRDAVTRYLGALRQATSTEYWQPGNREAVDALEAAAELGIPIESESG
jgi:hypothetical protein